MTEPSVLSDADIADLAVDVQAAGYPAADVIKDLLCTLAAKDAEIAELLALISVADKHAKKLRVAHDVILAENWALREKMR